MIANSVLLFGGGSRQHTTGPWNLLWRELPNQIKRSPKRLYSYLCTVFLSNVFGPNGLSCSSIRGLSCPAVLRNRNRRNRIILTQEEPEPEPYPFSRFWLRFRFRLRFLLYKKYQTKSTLTALADTCMKLARDEAKIEVTGRSFYRKNNLKFKGRNRNRSRNRG